MTTTNSKPPTWFFIVSIITLLWNLGGVMSFVMYVTVSEQTLQSMSEADRSGYTAFPIWLLVIYFIAVAGSTIGNVLLLMRRQIATPVLLISFVAILIQMLYNLFLNPVMRSQGAAGFALPVAVIIIGGLLVWLSRHAQTKVWLRQD